MAKTTLETYLDQRGVEIPKIDRNGMTVAELHTECGNRRVAVKSKDTKGVLIKALERQDQADLVGKLTHRQRRRLRKKGF